MERGGACFFSKAALKGLPRPFNVAGWRCSKTAFLKSLLNGGGDLITQVLFVCFFTQVHFVLELSS